jgi:hypothetical protein
MEVNDFIYDDKADMWGREWMKIKNLRTTKQKSTVEKTHEIKDY